MVKGGIYFLDLTDITIGGDPVTISGIWDALIRTYGKIIAVTLDIGDGAIMKIVPTVIYQSDSVAMDVVINIEGTLTAGQIQISDEDAVQIVIFEGE